MKEFYITRIIQRSQIKWVNGNFGVFIDFEKNFNYRFIDCLHNGKPSVSLTSYDDFSNFPIIACGLIGFIIKKFHRLTLSAFHDFFLYHDRFFKDKDSLSIPAKDDFVARYVEPSNDVFPYIPPHEGDLIIYYIEAYYNHILKDFTRLRLDDFVLKLIPNFVTPAFSKQVENLFLHGRTAEEPIDWFASHTDMRKILKPLFDNGDIPHTYYSDWIDFVINNFTKKGKPVSKKSIQNEASRECWQKYFLKPPPTLPNHAKLIPYAPICANMRQ